MTAKGKIITAWFIVTLIFLCTIYDIYIGVNYGSAATISWVTWTTAKGYPIIPFAAGILCGHLFWSQQTVEKETQ